MKYVALIIGLALSGCEMTAEDWKSVSAAVGETADTSFRVYDGYQQRQQPGYYQQPAVMYPYPTYAPSY